MELKSTDTSTPNLIPASCLRCKEEVWVWPGTMNHIAQVLCFDLLRDHTGSMLFVHDCAEDDETGLYFEDEDYDPEDYADELAPRPFFWDFGDRED